MLDPSTLFAGSTLNVLGAVPKVHVIIAPVVTFCPIVCCSRSLRV
jgi:hypothetical protein